MAIGVLLYLLITHKCPNFKSEVIRTIDTVIVHDSIPTTPLLAKRDTGKYGPPIKISGDSSLCCQELQALIQDTSEYSTSYSDSAIDINVNARVVGGCVDSFFLDYKSKSRYIIDRSTEYITVHEGIGSYRAYIMGEAALGKTNSYKISGAYLYRRSLFKAGYNVTNKQVEVGYGIGIY